MKGNIPVLSDFDGVYADSFQQLYELNAMAFRRIDRQLSPEQFITWFQQNVKKAKRQLLSNDADFETMNEAFLSGDADYYKRVALFPFGADLLRTLSETCDIIITSSTRAELIEALLERNGLVGCTQAVLGGGMGKSQLFEHALSILKMQPQDTFFVADTLGDIQEAKEFGLRTVAVSWGFHPASLLATAQPEKLVNKPSELVEYLQSQK